MYYGTTVRPERYHLYDAENQDWPKHRENGLRHGQACGECREAIRKVSRLVMVDQLWMWILDERTIITCFPGRYGTVSKRHDASAVHKSIRDRLNGARRNQVRSVFDLALVILEECFNTFFDRTKTADRQPQVIDIFSEAIGNVVSAAIMIGPAKQGENWGLRPAANEWPDRRR